MELNELFEQFSVETIVDKTNIPKEKLEDLKNREWDKFKRAQALGFLNILEREFNTTLESAKEECKNFFQQQEPQHTSASIDFVESQVAQSSNGGVVSKLIALVTLAALGYAGWYYYNKQNPSFNMINETNTTVEEDSNKEANSSKEDTKKKENSNIIKEQKLENVNKIEDKEAPKDEPKEDSKVKQEPVNKKFNITPQEPTEVKKEPKKEELSIEQNSEDSNKNVNTTTEPTQKSVKAEVESLLNENNKTKEKNSTANEDLYNIDTNTTDVNTTDILGSDSNDSNLTTQDTILDSEQTANKLPDSIKLVVNSKRLWLGIYNVDSGKKISKIIKRSTTLDLTNGKLAIITGHSKFSLVTDNETKKYTKKGKMYLLLSKEEGIKTLTRKEYKELTKRRAW